MDVATLACLDVPALERKLGAMGSFGAAVAAVQKEWVCVARGSHLVLLAVGARGAVEYQAVDDAELQGDSVTCVEFLALPSSEEENSGRRVAQRALGVVVCGTAGGWLRWFHTDGHLLLSHRLHDTSVVRIKENAFLFHGGVVVLLEQDNVLGAIGAAIRGGNVAPPTLSYQKFELEGQRLINDLIACGGAEEADPWSTFKTARSKQLLICGGAFPMLGVYAPLDKHGRLSTAVAIASELTSKLTSAVFSMAKSWWSSGNEGSPAPSPVKQAKLEEARPLDMGWELSDSAREIQAVALAPSDHGLAAACDSFGRVLLLDLHLQVVVRLWKGYREAQVAWIEQDEALFLVVYAPRRGVLEVWRMRHGQREAIMDVGTDCRLLRSGKCCYLLRASGQLQRVQFSVELSNHLKSDQATLEKIRAREGGSPVELVRQMRYPKLLVQAVLALSKHDPSSLFLEMVTAALEQCNTSASGSSDNLPTLTPGAAASRVMSPDVTHLVWLDRYVRAFRAIESDDPTMSCRQFLWCFSVHGSSEARLTAGITTEKRLQLARLFFSAAEMAFVSEALRWTRLAQADAELLLADCLVHGPFKLEEQAIAVFAGKGKLNLDETAPVPLLPVVLQQVRESTDIAEALRVTALVLGSHPGSEPWLLAQHQLSLLSAIPASAQWQAPSIALSLEGAFSVFKVLAVLRQAQMQEEFDRVAAAFPEHVKREKLLSVHSCLESLAAWSNDAKDASSNAMNTTLDEDGGSEEGSEDEEKGPSSTQAHRLAAAANVFLSSGGALALHSWSQHLAPVFWRCASLVELARKIPSEHVVVKTLQMADIAEMRHACTAARDCLKVALDAWKLPHQDPDESAVPFPSHSDAAVVLMQQQWAQRKAEHLAELRQIHLLACAVCSVLKYGLRGVNIACALPKDSPLRANITTAKSRFGTVDFLRRMFVLKLLPANNNLAVAFARSLNVDLAEVRKMAGQM